MESSQGDFGDVAIQQAGYQPQLRRSLDFFSSFAISFSYMSVLTGIYANFNFVVRKAGFFGLWTWPLVAAGQMLVALVFADLAGRIPLTGCSYNWNTRLSHPLLGWYAGWMALFAYAVGVAAVSVTIFPIVQSFAGVPFDARAAPYVGVALVLVQALLNIYGVRTAARFNLVAVAIEIATMVVFGVLLVGALISHHDPNVSSLLHVPVRPRPYLPAFMISSLLAAWTLLGFEGAADVAEETVNVRQVAPKSIIRSTLACGALGFLFVAVLALAAADPTKILASSDPVTEIMVANLGPLPARIFLVFVVVAVIACSLVNMTGASRVIFAMARDDRFVGSFWLKKVSRRQVPANAIWTVAVVASFFVCIADSATSLYGSGAVLFTLFYLLTVIGYAIASNRLPGSEGFSLGTWRHPIVAVAIAWLITDICILTIPKEYHSVTITTGYVLLAGIALYLIKGRQRAAVRIDSA